DQRDDFTVSHAEGEAIKRLNGLLRTIDAQREALGDIDEVDCPHYFASSSALARTSGATTFARSTGFGMLPFLSSISCIQASFSARVLPLVIMHTRMKFGSASRPVASSFTFGGAIGRYSVETIAASTTPTVRAL